MSIEIVFQIFTCLIFIVVGFFTYKQTFSTRFKTESFIYWSITIFITLIFLSSSDKTIRSYLLLAALGMCLGSLAKDFLLWKKK